MVSANTVIEGGLALYMLFGSTSFGYIMLRAGWPNIRSIGVEYKSGVGIIFGIIFSAAAISISIASHFLGFSVLSLAELLLANTVILAAASLLVLTLKRKFWGTQKVRVSVPKRVVSANILAKKAFQKIPQKNYAKEQPAETAQARAQTTMQKAAETNREERTQPSFLRKEIPKPFFGEQKKTWPAAGPKDYSRDVSLERQKKADELIGLIEKKEAQKKTRSIVTREELESRADKQQQFIQEDLREKIGGKLEEEKEEKGKEKDFEERLPRSTRLLKELLEESGGKLHE